ncbi:sulfatase-like hydrolase/transferase [Alloalcanivorax mobilis]|uniref:sulfatase-like hydrolase/transferase n=1 Tax=Alloalcanivorax mobilis TaxID=2019569 RepID=UPI000B5B3B29|nr:sulfatase-like hydrolase/transferase [Alloalcanivorax mobilis]ASK33972.1 sulfatase [Alcanivorax sp. N3-2A]|tara:strand:- start:33345 stop:35063 length:1719 start_codon:yes stop_codon:yes gene_type:complete
MDDITRRQVLKNIALGAAALGAAPALKAAPALGKGTSSATKGPPNVLLLVSDQERCWEDLPGALDLPAHEKLLTRGTGFTRYYANTSPCSPSRSVMYTGQHTMRTHMTANLHAPPFPTLNRDLPTLGHVFRRLGYHTAYKGKWHLSDIKDGPGLMYGSYPSRTDALDQFGFSEYNLTGDVHGSVWQGFIADRMVSGEASQWLMRTGQQLDKPWLLAVNFVNPHDIMFFSSGEKQERSRTNPAFMAPLRPAPHDPIYRRDWSQVGLPASFYKDDLHDKPWSHRSYAQVIDSLYGRMDRDDEAAWLANQSYYFNCIRDVSRQVDQVLQALEESGQLDNTIIVYTADHGEMAGAHGLRQKGPMIYKENSRVPLIVSHPDVAGGRSVENLGSTLDLLPTLVSLATEGQGQSDTPGVDLSPALGGQVTDRDRKGILFAYGVTLYTDPETTRRLVKDGDEITPVKLMTEFLKQLRLGPELGNRGLHRGVYDGRYKFARYFSPDSHHTPKDWDTLTGHNDLELYDTLNDPDELVNLAAKPEQVKPLLMAMSNRTNALVAEEVGEDNGSEFPGPSMMYTL